MLMTVETPARRPLAVSCPPVVVVAAAAGLLTTLLRLLGLGRAQDIFVDEPLYVSLGHSVLSGGFPTVNGTRFFLHPPGFFYLEAAWARLFGSRAGPIAGVYDMRALNAVLAGATAGALVLLVARAGSLRTAAAAGVLFALDPFCIRQNGRVLLETAMIFWVLVGYVVLLPLTEPGPAAQSRRRPPVAGRRLRQVLPRALVGEGHGLRAVCAGLMFGLAVLTKDEAALITVVPLMAAAALAWNSPRRPLLVVTAGMTVVPYVIYVMTVAAAGDLGEFWAAKTSGALRLLGLLQVTGFNAPRAPALTARLADELRYFGTTYVLLAASLVALVLLARRGNPSQRLLALFYASAVLVLGYAVALGTLEEQELYVMVVPALAALGAASGLLVERLGHRPAFRGGTLGLLAVVLGLNVTTYLQWRSRPDDGYAQLRHYMAAHVPEGSRVAAADGSSSRSQQEQGPSSWVLRDRYDVVRWVWPRDRAEDNVRYLVVPWKDVDQGYSYLSTEAVRTLTENADPLFTFRGRTYGRLVLYRLPQAAGHMPAPGAGSGSVSSAASLRTAHRGLHEP
jgi:4-amino-4-deoxy-L-arabinose transferase-like glycosyltransferase